ncbi:polymer-forming cytoskeletal protein [Halobacteriales archaeon Cl-PHB]
MPSFRSDPLDELIIPDETTVEEHDLVTEGDVVVGGQSTVEFGVRGRTVMAGERARFGGHIEAEGDCRLDMWSEVADNVLVGEDAYLGERVQIDGELKVAGDLDIGDDVDIEDGFEANGWIVIRNPMPTIVFLFVYLSQLLRIGEEEAAEEMLSAVLKTDDEGDQPVVIPRGARVGDEVWRVSTPARIGDHCRLHGNIRAEEVTVGHDNEIFGGIRAKEGVTIGSGTEVTGNVTSRGGKIAIGPEAHVRGDVSADTVAVHHEAEVEGSIRARDEMEMMDEAVLDAPVVGAAVPETPDVPDGDEEETSSDESAVAETNETDEVDSETDADADDDTDESADVQENDRRSNGHDRTAEVTGTSD